MNIYTRYILTFLITTAIFLGAWFVSSYFSNQRLARIEREKNEVALSVLQNEELLRTSENKTLCSGEGLISLSQELSVLASRIAYTEEQGSSASLVQTELKKEYTLLQVKDYLAQLQKSTRCGTPLTTVLYFYDTKERCQDCLKQSFVLDAIRQLYPEVRVYSFDQRLELSAISALKASHSIGETFPSLVINGKTYTGFQSLETVQRVLALYP